MSDPNPTDRGIDGRAASSRSATAPDGTCLGFHWISQTRRSCEKCGRPEWEHHGWAKPDQEGFAFGPVDWILDPWTPEQAQRMAEIREAWEANAVYEMQTRCVTDYLQRQTEVTVRVRYGRDMPDGDDVEVVSRRAC